MVATVAVLDDASRRAMAARGVDAAAYAEKRERCLLANGTSAMPFWDAEMARAAFAKATDLERCELESVDQTFAMVTCSKKSRRGSLVPAGRVIKRAGVAVSAREHRGSEKRNNAVQHMGRALESEAGGARVASRNRPVSATVAPKPACKMYEPYVFGALVRFCTCAYPNDPPVRSTRAKQNTAPAPSSAPGAAAASHPFPGPRTPCVIATEAPNRSPARGEGAVTFKGGNSNVASPSLSKKTYTAPFPSSSEGAPSATAAPPAVAAETPM